MSLHSSAVLADGFVEVIQRSDRLGRVGDGVADAGQDVPLRVEAFGDPCLDKLLVTDDRTGLEVADAGDATSLSRNLSDVGARARASTILFYIPCPSPSPSPCPFRHCIGDA